MQLWKDYFQDKDKKEFSELAKYVYEDNGFTATVDFPGCLVWRELAERYPDAKLVLTVRDTPEKWWESASQTILCPSFVIRVLFLFHPFWRRFAAFLKVMYGHQMGWEEGRLYTLDDKDEAIAFYKKRNEEIMAAFPPSRLLVYNVKQGWAPLCEFLGDPVPETSFPRLNSRSAFQGDHGKVLFKSGILVAGAVALSAYLWQVYSFLG